MDEKIIEYLGGGSNVTKKILKDELQYFFIKDMGLVELSKIKKIETIENVELSRGKVIIYLKKINKKEKISMIKDYTGLANKILELIGGKENVTYFTHCITRLRFNIKDKNIVNMDELKVQKGILGAQWSGEQLQIIIGTDVEDVYETIRKVGDLEKLPAINENLDGDKVKKKWSINILFEVLSACMVPVLPALCGTGVIKGILVLLTTYMNISTESGVYILLNTVADTAFYFMPIFVTYAASKKFKVNTVVALMMIGLLLHPTITALVGGTFTLLGLDIPILNYSSTVFPAIISVWILSYVYKLIDKLLPKVLRFVLTPAISLIVMAPICLGIIGPIGYYIGHYLATFVSELFYMNAFIGGLVLGILRPFVLLTGMQTTFTPIILNNLSTYGYDFIWPVHSVFSMACCGVCIGAYLRARKSKNELAEEKEMFLSAFVSGFAGVSEPSLYGIAFRFKTQLAALVISSGISGSVVAGLGAKVYAAGNPPWLFLPGFGETAGLMIAGFIISFVFGVISSYLAGFSNDLKFRKDK